MNCKYCNFPLNGNETNCPSCGALVNLEMPPQSYEDTTFMPPQGVAPMPMAQQPMPPQMPPMPPQMPSVAPQQPDDDNKSPKGAIIAVIAIVLVIAIIGTVVGVGFSQGWFGSKKNHISETAELNEDEITEMYESYVAEEIVGDVGLYDTSNTQTVSLGLVSATINDTNGDSKPELYTVSIVESSNNSNGREMNVSMYLPSENGEKPEKVTQKETEIHYTNNEQNAEAPSRDEFIYVYTTEYNGTTYLFVEHLYSLDGENDTYDVQTYECKGDDIVEVGNLSDRTCGDMPIEDRVVVSSMLPDGVEAYEEGVDFGSQINSYVNDGERVLEASIIEDVLFYDEYYPSHPEAVNSYFKAFGIDKLGSDYGQLIMNEGIFTVYDFAKYCEEANDENINILTIFQYDFYEGEFHVIDKSKLQEIVGNANQPSQEEETTEEDIDLKIDNVEYRTYSVTEVTYEEAMNGEGGPGFMSCVYHFEPNQPVDGCEVVLEFETGYGDDISRTFEPFDGYGFVYGTQEGAPKSAKVRVYKNGVYSDWYEFDIPYDDGSPDFTGSLYWNEYEDMVNNNGYISLK